MMPTNQHFNAFSSNAARYLQQTQRNALPLVERIIPASVWENFSKLAIENDMFSNDLAAAEKKEVANTLSAHIATVWAQTQELQTRGYQLVEFKLQIGFESAAANIGVTCEATASHSGIAVVVNKVKLDGPPPVIEVQTTIVRPQRIKPLIEKVRAGEKPKDLPNALVNGIQRKLQENPAWADQNNVELGCESKNLDLYTLSLKPSLSFKHPSNNLVQTVAAEQRVKSSLYNGSFFFSTSKAEPSTTADKKTVRFAL